MDKELALAGLFASAQIVVGIIAWFFLGGSSIAQLSEAGLVAVLPISTVYFIRERRQFSNAQTKPRMRKFITTFNVIWIAILSLLIIYSWVMDVGPYLFNLASYVIFVGYTSAFYVLRSRTRYEAGESHQKVKLLPILLILFVLALIILLVILLQQTPWYPHAMGT